MIKRISLLISLACLPAILSAQLDNDGKTEVVASKDAVAKYSKPFTVLYAATSDIPFGIKLMYRKSFGAFISFKSDFDLTKEHYDVTAGAVKSLGKTIDIYLGGGLDLGLYEGWNEWDEFYRRNSPCLLTETGLIIKIRSFAIDLGIMIAHNEYEGEYKEDEKRDPYSSVYANFGLGFNF